MLEFGYFILDLMTRVSRCPGLLGTVLEWKEMSHVLNRFSPGQWNVTEWMDYAILFFQ